MRFYFRHKRTAHITAFHSSGPHILHRRVIETDRRNIRVALVASALVDSPYGRVRILGHSSPTQLPFLIAGFWHKSSACIGACVCDFAFAAYIWLRCIRCIKKLLLLGFDRLHGVEICYRVDEFIDLLDLEGPVIVGNDICNGKRFVMQINPQCGLRLLGELWGRYHVD